MKMMQTETDMNTGVFICTGCDLGKCLDIDNLVSGVVSDAGVKHCEQHKAYCSKEGIEAMKLAISDNDLQEVVLAACSPRVKQDQFRFLSLMKNERVNLREQVIWSHESNNDDTQDLAKDLVLMSIARIRANSKPE